MSDLRELYQQLILDHNKNPRNFREISDANRVIMQRGTICVADVPGWWSDAGTQTSFRKANAEVWDAVDQDLAHRLDIMAIASQEDEENKQ